MLYGVILHCTKFDSIRRSEKADHWTPQLHEVFFLIEEPDLIYYTMLCYAMLYYAMLYYTILYYTILEHTIIYYTILYYTILYYTIL